LVGADRRAQVALLGSFPPACPCRYDRQLSPSSKRTACATRECPSHLAGGQCCTGERYRAAGPMRRAAKGEPLITRGISAHQLAQFRRWEQSAAKPAEYRTLAIYAQRRNIIASIDRRWDGTITTAQVEVDRATNDLAVATADLLSTMPTALASELTGLSVRRLSKIVHATANTHSAPTTRTVQHH